MGVVSLRGTPTVETTNETPQEVHDILREATGTADGETHTAVAVILVDKQGRLLNRKYSMSGSAYTLLAGLELLKSELIESLRSDD